MITDCVSHPSSQESSLELVVLTRNRPKLLEQTIISALSQKSPVPVSLIISDNSSTNETERICAKHWPHVRYRRYLDVPQEVHIRSAIDRCKSTYLMLFHDDDILLANCIDTMVCALQENPGAAAVAANAFLLKQDKLTPNTFLCQQRQPTIIHSPRELIDRYFDFTKGGIAPFPAYIYRRECISGSYFNPRLAGGKYADVSFLLRIIESGSFIWIHTPLVAYRLHPGQDSASISFLDWFQLIQYVTRRYHLDSRDRVLLDYKARFYRSTFKLGSRSLFSKNARRRRLARLCFAIIGFRLLVDYRCSLYQLHLLARKLVALYVTRHVVQST